MQLYAQSMRCHLLGVASVFLTFSNFILKTVYSFSHAWSSLFILFQGHLLFIFP